MANVSIIWACLGICRLARSRSHALVLGWCFWVSWVTWHLPVQKEQLRQRLKFFANPDGRVCSGDSAKVCLMARVSRIHIAKDERQDMSQEFPSKHT